jgi:hypothetical protein
MNPLGVRLSRPVPPNFVQLLQHNFNRHVRTRRLSHRIPAGEVPKRGTQFLSRCTKDPL